MKSSSSTLVSVLLPVFNSARFLSEAIRSVLAQTHSDLELIIIDDGSRDQSQEIANEFSRADPRVRVYRQENAGISAALNRALALAKGEFVARMDGDDVCLPNRLELQLEFLRNSDLIMVGSNVRLINPNGMSLVEIERSSNHEEIESQLLSGDGSAIIHPTMFCRRNDLESIGGYRQSLRWMEDLDLFLRLARIGRLGNMNQVLLLYRQHPMSTNHTSGKQQSEFRRIVLGDAYRERGIPFHEFVGKRNDFETVSSVEWPERYRRWAWTNLLDARNRSRAFMLWTHALRLQPFDRGNLSLAFSLAKSLIFPRRYW
jgi:glycosyltransferase involved in cell wall biosynthesis